MDSHQPSNFRYPAAVVRFVGACVLGLAIDLGTKIWAFRVLDAIDPITDQKKVYRFIPGWLHFEITTNRGAVFGLGQGQRWLFIGVSVIAIAFLSWLFSKSERKHWHYQILLGILLAGVLGNLYDRIMYGYVRDMIHALPRWPNLFPYIFNFADSLLCAGVFLVIVYSLFHKPAQQELEPQMNADERG